MAESLEERMFEALRSDWWREPSNDPTRTPDWHQRIPDWQCRVAARICAALVEHEARASGEQGATDE